MKYILAIGIGFKKIHKPLEIRISSKNFLIDQLHIENELRLKDTWRWHSADVFNCFSNTYYDLFDQIQGKHPLNRAPEKLFFYEIEGQALGDKIDMQIDCMDNNYTNGFMTKTSLMCLRTVQLLPKKFLSVLLNKMHHRVIKRNELKSRFPRPEETRRYGSWPCQKKSWQYIVDQKNAVLRGEAKDVLEKPIQPDTMQVWVGGKYSICIPLINKFGIKMIKPYINSSNQYGKIRMNFFQWRHYYQKFYDINMRNEDQ